jgi:nucleotide-binding universal stress UspA family protein
VRQRDVLADVASLATIAVGSVVPAILKAAEHNHADLIVLCRHQRFRLGHLTHGRITEQIAKRAPVPVLVLHEHDVVSVSPVARHVAASV